MSVQDYSDRDRPDIGLRKFVTSLPEEKRVLLTGGAGFIGSHIAKALLNNGYVVDIIDDLSTGSLDNVPGEATLLQLDLCQSECISQIPKNSYQAILHLAGQSSGEQS